MYLKMKKTTLFALIMAYSCALFAQNRPNVIVVLADDIGVGDISYYRKIHSNNIVVETKTLDKLAKEGMIFTDARAPAALCAPSRYAIMTGNSCYRSDFQWGVWGAYEQSPIKPNQLTLGKLMKNAGYKTAFLGKWNLGGDFLKKDDSTQIYREKRLKIQMGVDIRKMVGGGPQSNGFDYSLTFPEGIQDVPYAVFENSVMMPLAKNSTIGFISQENMSKIGVKLDKDEGLGDTNWNPHNMGPLLVNKAVDFIEQNSHSKEPFFMYYCALAVHLPHAPTDKLNGTAIKGTTPSRHLDMVKELDVQMEMLVQALKKQGVYENTLIIFTSDNGGLRVKESIQAGHQSTDIFRGGKNQAYEGGNKVPFIACWHNKIKPNRRSDTPILGLDIMATLAALTQQKIADNKAVDSYNLMPILLDEKNIKTRPFIMTQSGTGKEVMITKNGWKLIMATEGKEGVSQKRKPIALFDLNDNLEEDEGKNLINKPDAQAKVMELLNLYNETRDSGKKTGI